jgi:hypothetical protein
VTKSCPSGPRPGEEHSQNLGNGKLQRQACQITKEEKKELQQKDMVDYLVR